MGIQIRKFQAPTLQKAIDQIRMEMGDNAIILQTEPLKSSGLLGKNAIEVTAAIDRKELAPRFHATVKDDGAERSTSSAKATWKNILSLGKSKQGAKSTAAPTTTKTAAQTAPIAAKVSAAVAQAAASSASASNATAVLSGSRTAEPAPTIGQLYAMKTFLEPLQKEVETLRSQMPATAGSTGSALKPAQTKRRVVDPLELEFHKLREEFENFMNEQRYEDTKLPHYFRQLMNFWTDRGVSSKQVLNFFKKMEEWGNQFDQNTAENVAHDTIAHTLEGVVAEANVLQKEGKRIVILVGPTGVGKTTTIAKMAAHDKLRRHRSVALLTVDDYKIGGTDQIAHYARILEVPFIKLRTDLGIEEQCRALDADTIFIDTFGVSPKEVNRIEALKKLLVFKDPELIARVETHLVLPVSVSSNDAKTQMAAFAALHPNYLLFTKWDETENWGGMLTTILETKKPVSFVSHGQAVPDDLSLFSKKDFIETVTTIDGSQNP